MANAATGQTVSTAAGAVYRFFDTKYGTHFFTSDIGERNTVLATRSDLKEETNGFGDVAQSDPNAVAVYRFFDTPYGTHFFTSSSTERDTIIATRPDLSYEAVARSTSTPRSKPAIRQCIAFSTRRPGRNS